MEKKHENIFYELININKTKICLQNEKNLNFSSVLISLTY